MPVFFPGTNGRIFKIASTEQPGVRFAGGRNDLAKDAAERSLKAAIQLEPRGVRHLARKTRPLILDPLQPTTGIQVQPIGAAGASVNGESLGGAVLLGKLVLDIQRRGRSDGDKWDRTFVVSVNYLEGGSIEAVDELDDKLKSLFQLPLLGASSVLFLHSAKARIDAAELARTAAKNGFALKPDENWEPARAAGVVKLTKVTPTGAPGSCDVVLCPVASFEDLLVALAASIEHDEPGWARCAFDAIYRPPSPSPSPSPPPAPPQSQSQSPPPRPEQEPEPIVPWWWGLVLIWLRLLTLVFGVAGVVALWMHPTPRFKTEGRAVVQPARPMLPVEVNASVPQPSTVAVAVAVPHVPMPAPTPSGSVSAPLNRKPAATALLSKAKWAMGLDACLGAASGSRCLSGMLARAPAECQGPLASQQALVAGVRSSIEMSPAIAKLRDACH